MKNRDNLWPRSEPKFDFGGLELDSLKDSKSFKSSAPAFSIFFRGRRIDDVFQVSRFRAPTVGTGISFLHFFPHAQRSPRI